MGEKKRTGLIKEAQSHTPMQGAAATVNPTEAKNKTFYIMEVLPTGKENAINSQELCNRLGFDSIRELQLEIARERKAGAVILSTCQEGGGYFLPGNCQEVKQFIRTLENRARNTFMALRSARAFLDQQEEKNNS